MSKLSAVEPLASADHVVTTTTDSSIGAKCLHCGAAVNQPLPVEVKRVCRVLNEFIWVHRQCKPKEAT